MAHQISFVDEVKIAVKGGDGGRGCIAFRREKYIPKGGPSGGDGGDGGSVIFEGHNGLLTLLDFKYQQHLKGERGEHGLGKGCNGRRGADFIAKVPLGTIVRDMNSDRVLGEILDHGQRLVAANGGRGGRGNRHFATSTNRTPRQAEPGFPGEDKKLILELKLIADIGIIGAPNAGKSTLINAIAATQSRVGQYPFTTLNPVLGVINFDREHRIVLADMPGLIEGASQGKGLGHKFLKHIERAKALVVTLDMSADPVSDYNMLKDELTQYKSDLWKRACIIAANKMDLPQSKDNLKNFKNSVEHAKIYPISALEGVGIDKLISGMKKYIFTK